MPVFLDSDELDRCSAIFGPPPSDDPEKVVIIITVPKSTLIDKAKKFIRKLLISKADRKAEKDERINNVLRLYQQRLNNDNGIPSPPESGISGTSAVTPQSDTTASTTTDQPATATDTNVQPTATATDTNVQPTATATTDGSTTTNTTTARQQEEMNTSQPDLTAIINQLTAAVIATVTNAAQPATAATATTTPQPAATTAQPAAATTQTATTTPQAAATTAQPSTTTPQAAATTAQPSTTTPQAAATTAQPSTTTAQPATNTAQPATNTAQPATVHTAPPSAAPSNPPTEASSSIPTQSAEPQASTNSSSSNARTRPKACGVFLQRPIPMIDTSSHEQVNFIPSRCQTMPRPIDLVYDGYGIPRIRSLQVRSFIPSSVLSIACELLRQSMGVKPYVLSDPRCSFIPQAIIGKGVNGYVTSVIPSGCVTYTTFAIKPIEINASKASIRERIKNEVHLMNQGHNNIVELCAVYSHDRCVFLVMEELRCNLRTLMLQSPNFLIPARTALHIFDNILSGLYFMHQLRYYHGGIRPENILLGVNGQVKLGGFGSSGHMDNRPVRNEIGLDFNAPDRYLSDKSDVWALAATTRVLFDPFDYSDPSYSQRDIVSANTSIPPALKTMLCQMLAQNVRDRPNTTNLTDEFNQNVTRGILLPGTQNDVILALTNTRQQ